MKQSRKAKCFAALKLSEIRYRIYRVAYAEIFIAAANLRIPAVPFRDRLKMRQPCAARLLKKPEPSATKTPPFFRIHCLLIFSAILKISSAALLYSFCSCGLIPAFFSPSAISLSDLACLLR